MMRLRVAMLVACTVVALVPTFVAAAPPECDATQVNICCDRDPVAIIMNYAGAGTRIVADAIAHTDAFAGKTKCTVYEVAFLCSDETWPPTVSTFRTNPTNVHGHFSPCFEIFTPGFEHLGGCPTARALRHDFAGWPDTHTCVPLERIILPSG